MWIVLYCFTVSVQEHPFSIDYGILKGPLFRVSWWRLPAAKNSDKLCDVAAAVCVGNGGADGPPNKWLKLILAVFVTVLLSPIVKSWIILQFGPVIFPLLSSFVATTEWNFKAYLGFMRLILNQGLMKGQTE